MLAMLVTTILPVTIVDLPHHLLVITIRLALVTMTTLGIETAMCLLLLRRLITEVVVTLNLLIVVLPLLLLMLPTIATIAIAVIQNMLTIHLRPLLCRLDDPGRLPDIVMNTPRHVTTITETEVGH